MCRWHTAPSVADAHIGFFLRLAFADSSCANCKVIYEQFLTENYSGKVGRLAIITHLHGKLSLTQIADALSLNASYLSDLFQRCEGISITKFFREQKIRFAQNLLMYSDYSYSEIASYLGFASQSHLDKQFKDMTGMTLRQYREMYGVDHLKT